MFCEAYNRSLADAAASGEVLSPALQQHLALCESCRTAFAEECSLFAAIDSSLRAAANSEVPTTLIPRVHVAINNEPVPQIRGFNFLAWGSVGGLVTAAVVLAVLYMPPKRTPTPVETGRAASVATAQNPPVLSGVNPVHSGGVPTLQHKKLAVLITNRGSKPEAPEILVPDEERAAFAQFITHASPSAGNVVTNKAIVPRAPKEFVQISPIEIASLESRPLDQKEERQGQF